MESVFVFVIIIVLIGCGTGVINTYLKHRRELAETRPSAGLRQELDALRDRAQVLEKIVTDQGYELRRELDRLERHG